MYDRKTWAVLFICGGLLAANMYYSAQNQRAEAERKQRELALSEAKAATEAKPAVTTTAELTVETPPPPTEEEFKEIFQRICDSYGLPYNEDVMAFLLKSFYRKHKVPFAGFHPKFIAEHVVAACNYLGVEPEITEQWVVDSLEDMVILPQTTAHPD